MAYVPLKVYSLLSIRSLYSILHSSFDKGFSFAGESHNFWELSVLLKGKAGMSSGNDVFMCREGEAVLQAPNVFHTLWVENDETCEIFTISFDGTGINGRLCSGKYILTEEENNYIHSILNELPENFKGYSSNELAEFSSISDIEHQIIKSFLELFCLSLFRRGNQAMGLPVSDEKTKCYSRITTYLKDNVNRNLTMEIISREVYESPAKIKLLFKQYAGTGCMQYFNYLRCENIIKLLKEGKKVKDIAYEMDFSSPYYLSYFFKREMGMTAREYINSSK